MLKRILVYGILAAALAGGWLAWFATHPVALPRAPYEFTVHAGASLKSIARQLAGWIAGQKTKWHGGLDLLEREAADAGQLFGAYAMRLLGEQVIGHPIDAVGKR